MISTTLGDCLNAQDALTRLAAQSAPPKTAYRVAKLLRLIRDETKQFHVQRDALVLSLGAPRAPTAEEKAAGANGSITAVLPEHLDTFAAKLNELCAVPVEIAAHPLTIEDVEAFASVRADDLMRLGACLVEPGSS